MTFNDNAQLDTSQVESGGSGGFGGGRGGMGGGTAVGGIGGLILMLIFAFFGIDITGSGGGSSYPGGASGLNQYSQDTQDVSGSNDRVSQQIQACKTGADANEDDTCRVIGTVNAVQAYWDQALPDFTGGRTEYEYAPTKLYSGQTSSGCGTASSQMGPFYCPNDRKVYIDTSFFQELSSTYGADGGNLAQMYVVAHEYGHHIQDLLGALGRAQQDPKGPESGSVRLELQADCYAGIWVNHATEAKDKNGTTLLQPVTEADIKSALSAASAVGDDRIQQKAQGRVTPESWTHGSSEQRQKWFLTGFQSGQLNSCDTFNAQDLG
ncbi:hypothetical protein EVU97_03200 [Dermacoccus sp. 147Ba]|uniref:KPN_02809 family neutral zinc metallopeptidase n=1 Tax=Dermacoccus sp. 147Ba TaxID=2510111 RepID=UPI00101BF36F|nr:neutral zinc metallopeptidase [Dermacoccus sp. 147Ba]RYI23709.1 hypothetical protein EVU97_03200 [Dermacoccus sp. 147Ba]